MKPEEIKQLLPEVFQRGANHGTPLYSLLKIMEVLHQPVENCLGCYPDLINPYRASDRMIPFLATWVDLERFFSPHWIPQGEREPIAPGLGRLRELIQAAAELSKWRGTHKGLTLFLEMATGVQGFDLEETTTSDAHPPFHLTVWVPEAAQPYAPLIERIVSQEKPVYMTHEVKLKHLPGEEPA